MAGKRLLDAALVLSATRNVAKQHIRIRSEQFDVWSKTSTIAKAVQNQTDRITLTAQAAAAIARRLNEQAPSPRDFTTQAQRTRTGNDVPRRESVDHADTDRARQESLQQDHHYRRSEQNATQQPHPTQEREVAQEQPQRRPTPDGSIPPASAPVDLKGTLATPLGDFSDRAAVPPKRDPLEQEQPASNADLKPVSAKESTIPDPDLADQKIPEKDAVPEQDEVPEGVNTDVFHTPRVKQMLGGKDTGLKPGVDLPLPGSKPSSEEQIKPADDKDQETFNTRMSTQHPTSSADTAAGDNINDLATDIARDQESMQEAATQVCAVVFVDKAKLI